MINSVWTAKHVDFGLSIELLILDTFNFKANCNIFLFKQMCLPVNRKCIYSFVHFCAAPQHVMIQNIPFWSFDLFQVCLLMPTTPYSVTRRYSWILLLWRRRGRLVCQAGVRLAFLRWHWLDNVSVSAPTDTHMRPKEAISVVPPTPYCSLTYGRYYIAYHVGESSGSTIRTMHLGHYQS